MIIRLISYYNLINSNLYNTYFHLYNTYLYDAFNYNT